MLFECILAANYLDVRPLTELCCARLARIIVGRSPEQIKEYFHAEGEFTPEQYADLMPQEVEDGLLLCVFMRID